MLRSIQFCAFILLLFLISQHILQSQTVGIKFFVGSWAEVLEKAKEERKYIFIELYGKHCLYCTHMDTAVFTSPHVFPLYNQRFVSFKINYSEGDFNYYDMAQSYSVDLTDRYLPILLYFDSEGNVLRKETGGKTTAEMKAIADEVLARPKGKGIIAKPIESKEEEQLIYTEPNIKKTTPAIPEKSNTSEKKEGVYTPHFGKEKAETPVQIEKPKNQPKSSPQINTNTELRQSSSYTSPPSQQLKSDNDRLNELSVYFNKDTTMVPEKVREYAYLLLKLHQPYNQVVNYYLNLESKNLSKQVNLDFIYDFTLNLENKAIDYFVSNIHYYKRMKGGQKVNEKTQNAIEYTVLNAIKSKDLYLFSKAEETIYKTYLPEKEEFLFEMRSLFYQGIEDWDTYSKIVVQYLDKFSVSDPKLLNEIAVKFLRNINDKKMLYKALEWIELSIKIDHEYYNHFTCSQLLYRLGHIDKAILAAQNAIYLNKLRMDGTDPKPCELFLERLYRLR